jgi:hypothetical protein
MHLNIAVWGAEQVLAVVWGWVAKEVWAVAWGWEAKEVQALAETGHNVMLNADWIAEYFYWIKDVTGLEEVSEAIIWETD